MDPVLEVRNLRVEYRSDGRTVVGADRVSFAIGPGEIFGLAGESGCGKSTIANAVMRLLKPPAQITAGDIRFQGRDVLALAGGELRAFRWRQIAMVFQSAMNSLNPVLTIGEQIGDIFTTHEKLSRRAARDRAGELLELVGIDPERLKAYPHQLSGGMRQRVVIAMAVALHPRLLIMDEPTTALDVVVQQEIMAQIRDLQRELGFSILFITHDMSLMVELSQRIGVMYGGRIVELAAADDLFAKPLHPYSEALMNAFPPLTGPRRELTGLFDAPRTTDSCGFHIRCPPDRSDCSMNIPDLREVAPGRWVARSTEGDLR
ncbi:ABC transporter ATP-binding protein [Paractinoplanes ferrugineus]|uniref:Peptide ABC transporter ATP-binding protein n=1 Tax=Paractinoplanes ferrugineus TaxID=113564 RepID=A0A919MFH1_9ACTN|nr:ABC transporter ATP-binding protein [Actinoplanes ferrugineus]GIE13788.1 peptide ABC transporter ATP-binding protein [Actinoplanes ferrugineus]